MFLNSADYPWTTLLEQTWQAVRDEFRTLKSQQLFAWPEKDLYRGSWDVFGLFAFGVRLDDNCRRCPQTVALLDQIPGVTTAGFSRMAPRTRIEPHVGYTDTVVRCHLGLMIPERCGLQVGDQVASWTQGRCLVFDDTIRHSAWNDADEARIVLLIDVLKPGQAFDARTSPEIELLASSLASNPLSAE